MPFLRSAVAGQIGRPRREIEIRQHTIDSPFDNPVHDVSQARIPVQDPDLLVKPPAN